MRTGFLLLCFCAAAATLFSAAAASPKFKDNPRSAGEVKQRARIDDDKYTKVRALVGPTVMFHGDYSGGWFMRWWPKADALDGCQLFLVHRGTRWAFLDEAHDSEGNEMSVTLIDRSVSSGVVEQIGINFSRAYLEKHQKSGLDFRVDGKRGAVSVIVPAFYVEGFLSAIAEEKPASNAQR